MLTPSYGYFIANNLCLGASVTTLFSRSTDTPYANVRGLNSDSRTIGVGPMVRYYLPLDSKLYLYGTASYTWLWSNYKYESYDGTIHTNRANTRYTNWDTGLGLSYFISPSTAIEAGATFSQNRYNDDDDNVANKISRLAFNVGFRIFLPKG